MISSRNRRPRIRAAEREGEAEWNCSRGGASAMGMVGDAEPGPISIGGSQAHREIGKINTEIEIVHSKDVLP
jgi:hypothetical protein